MASITVRTNGQTLTVNASVSHWTSAALAVVASGDDDIPSTTTTTITSDYTMHFANTATTAVVTVKQRDGTTLLAQTFQVSPAVGPRTLNPVPDVYQVASDTDRARQLALAPTGALAETFPRSGATIANTATVLTTARLHCVAIYLPAGTTVTTASFLSGATAADTPLNQWFALYDSSRVLLGQTADDTTTAWGTQTLKTLTFAAPITTTYSGLHYLGIMVKATTVPALYNTSALATPLGVAPILNGYADTGLTDTAPATAAALTAAAYMPYGLVS
jgi:hypothetical protein